MHKKLTIMFCALSLGLAGLAAADGRGDRGNHGAQGLDDQNTVRARLNGPAMGGETPSGTAVSRSRDGQNLFRVEVQDVNLPDNTVLTVLLDHEGNRMRVGELRLTQGAGELDLRGRDGDQAPQAQSGDIVVVRQNHTAVLAGVFF